MNVLLSYGFYGTRPLASWLPTLFGDDEEQWPTVYVDSGAFQAHMGTRDVTLDGYATWLEEGRGLYEQAFNFDVIGDPKASAVNSATLAALGLETVPVFHGGEDWRYLAAMVEGWPLVALGGMASAPGRSGADTFAFIARSFNIAGSHAELHGLGMTTWEMLKAAPWASVDSSSWGSGHRYGTLNLWDGRALIRAKRNGPRWGQVVRGVLAAGFPIEALGDYRQLAVINAYAWLSMERALQVSRPDFKVFLVDGAPFALTAIHDARQRLEAA